MNKNVIRPVLVFKLSNYGLNNEEIYKVVENFRINIDEVNNKEEYIVLIFITENREHSVEMLNPNILTEGESKEYLVKIEEIKKSMDNFFGNTQKK